MRSKFALHALAAVLISGLLSSGAQGAEIDVPAVLKARLLADRDSVSDARLRQLLNDPKLEIASIELVNPTLATSNWDYDLTGLDGIALSDDGRLHATDDLGFAVAAHQYYSNGTSVDQNQDLSLDYSYSESEEWSNETSLSFGTSLSVTAGAQVGPESLQFSAETTASLSYDSQSSWTSASSESREKSYSITTSLTIPAHKRVVAKLLVQEIDDINIPYTFRADVGGSLRVKFRVTPAALETWGIWVYQDYGQAGGHKFYKALPTNSDDGRRIVFSRSDALDDAVSSVRLVGNLFVRSYRKHGSNWSDPDVDINQWSRNSFPIGETRADVTPVFNDKMSALWIVVKDTETTVTVPIDGNVDAGFDIAGQYSGSSAFNSRCIVTEHPVDDVAVAAEPRDHSGIRYAPGDQPEGRSLPVTVNEHPAQDSRHKKNK